MKRDSTVFTTHRHLISTFFGFVSREKKLEGIANITHTRNDVNDEEFRARAKANVVASIWEKMKMENKLVVLHPSSQTRRQQMQREKQKIEKNLISLFYKRIKKVQENLCRAAMFSNCERKWIIQATLLCRSRSPISCVHAKKSCLPKLWENPLPYLCLIDEDSSCVCALSSMIAITKNEQHKVNSEKITLFLGSNQHYFTILHPEERGWLKCKLHSLFCKSFFCLQTF